MHASYEDILKAAKCEPQWWDQNGVPRFAPFRPGMCPNIYSTTVILVRIACQVCGRQFDVEMHDAPWGGVARPPKEWHYGDPPYHCDETCEAGSTMNCEDLTVLEVWHRGHMQDWLRHPEWEGPIP